MPETPTVGVPVQLHSSGIGHEWLFEMQEPHAATLWPNTRLAISS